MYGGKKGTFVHNDGVDELVDFAPSYSENYPADDGWSQFAYNGRNFFVPMITSDEEWFEGWGVDENGEKFQIRGRK